jgi:matrixin
VTPSVSRLLLSFLVAIAILPGAASADSGLPQVPVPASDALTTTAHALAVAHWGADPCAGQVTVTWAHMGAGINARSQWMSYDVHNPATFTQCSITYNLDVDWDWPKLCTVIEHELGHLAGHEHVNDPHDVMSPYYVLPTAECAAGSAPAAAPAPVTTAQAPVATPAATKATSKKKAKRKVSKPKASTRSAKGKAAAARSARAAKKSGTKKKSSAKKSGSRARAASSDSSDQPLLWGCTLVSA